MESQALVFGETSCPILTSIYAQMGWLIYFTLDEFLSMLTMNFSIDNTFITMATLGSFYYD